MRYVSIPFYDVFLIVMVSIDRSLLQSDLLKSGTEFLDETLAKHSTFIFVGLQQ